MAKSSSPQYPTRVILSALALSLTLHAFLIYPLLHGSRVEKQAHEPIEIVFAESSTPTDASSSKPSRSQTRALRPQATLSHDILSGGFQSQTRQQLAESSKVVEGLSSGDNGSSVASDFDFKGDPMTKVAGSFHGGSPGVQYGNAMGLTKTLETLPFFEALYDRVNRQLVYPDDFSRQRVTGRVRIEAEVSSDGRLLKFVSTTADDRLLQTYCFAALMQILSTPLAKGFRLPHERALVSFDFEFQVRIPGDTPRLFVRTVQKNRLAFGRENEVDPWLNEKIEEVFTHYVPPIIPFPGGFYVDFVMAYKYVNNLIEGAPTESEQRQARIEKLHESLRQTLKQAARFTPPLPSPTPET